MEASAESSCRMFLWPYICHIVHGLERQTSMDLLVVSLLRGLAGGNTRQAFIISRRQQWMSRYPGLLTHFCLITHSFSPCHTRTHTQSFYEFDNHSQVRLMSLLTGGPVSEGRDCWREKWVKGRGWFNGPLNLRPSHTLRILTQDI